MTISLFLLGFLIGYCFHSAVTTLYERSKERVKK